MARQGHVPVLFWLVLVNPCSLSLMRTSFFLAVAVSASVVADEPKRKGYDFDFYMNKPVAKPTGETQAELESAKFEKLEIESRRRALQKFGHLYSDPKTGFADYTDDEVILAEAKQDPVLDSPDWPEKIAERVMAKYFKVASAPPSVPRLASDPQAAPVDYLTTLKAAYAAGKTIQRWSPEKQAWFDVIGEPRWNTSAEFYQIKPEPEPVKAPQISASPEQQARWMAEAREAAKPKPDPVSEALKNLPQFIEAKRKQEQQDRIESLLERQAFLLFQQQYGQK